MSKTYLYIILICSPFFAKGQTDTIKHNSYTFVKEWSHPMSESTPLWHKADWTFPENSCEFSDKSVRFYNGKLQLVIDKKSTQELSKYPDKPYLGGEYYTSEKYLYGRFEVVMKPNTPAGVVTSFFLMNIAWNQDYSKALEWSEIDIEFAGKTNAVQFTVHWIDDQGIKQMQPKSIPLKTDASKDFNTWAIEWTPTYINYYLNNELLYSITDSKLLQEQAIAQEIHLNHWVSPSVEWVGSIDESNMPITTQYQSIIYYRLEKK